MTKFQVVCWIKLDPEGPDRTLFTTMKEANEEALQLTFLQPENIYQVESINIPD